MDGVEPWSQQGRNVCIPYQDPIGMTVTGMPALAAIAGVVAAPPGLMTSADLPLRGFAGRFKR